MYLCNPCFFCHCLQNQWRRPYCCLHEKLQRAVANATPTTTHKDYLQQTDHISPNNPYSVRAGYNPHIICSAHNVLHAISSNTKRVCAVCPHTITCTTRPILHTTPCTLFDVLNSRTSLLAHRWNYCSAHPASNVLNCILRRVCFNTVGVKTNVQPIPEHGTSFGFNW